jgi:predicted nucleotidyltransferase
MADTPSINPTQVSARNTLDGVRFNSVLFSTLDALEDSNLPFAMIGGLASAGMGRPRSTHDIDVFVTPEDAESILQTFAKHGFKIVKHDIQWLFKAFKDDILVDIIFRSKGDIYFDEEMQAHRKHVEFHGRQIPMVAPEDLAIIKCAVHYEGGPHHWHDALAILSHAQIDWNYLLRRARRAPRRLLALLVYAQSSDILIPNFVVTSLFEYIYGTEDTTASAKPLPLRAPAAPSITAATKNTPDYLMARVSEALKEDGRTAQHDVRVTVTGHSLLVEGEASSEACRKAVAEVASRAAPGYEVENRVRVQEIDGPIQAEAIS